MTDITTLANQLAYSNLNEDDQLKVRVAVGSVIEQMAVSHAAGCMTGFSSDPLSLAMGYTTVVKGDALGVMLVDVSGRIRLPLLSGVNLDRDHGATRKVERDSWLDRSYQQARLGKFES
jgi:hypothetical protein